MYFNSFAFAVFLPVVWALYWSLARRPLWTQNLVILAASYFFYGWWDHRFLSLLILSSLLDFSLGRAMGRSQQGTTRRSLLALSLVGNLGMLCTFKYFNFFAGSLATAFASVGVHLDTVTLDVVLPVGISFYTFQTLSYTIDVYRKQLEPATDPIGFFAYVAFFPQLVAGPIERATNLLPQFATRRLFDPAKATDGLRQILWGLFKKAVIADACAPIVDRIFDPGASWSGSTLLLGIFLFAFQIYCDFSGYSDIAIGVARLFGFELMRNFAFPYFSRDIAEFWRRWHISLNTWFRDYVYIPLGGSKGGSLLRVRNILIVFLLSGLWHGANWTFVIWGLINALLFIPLLLSGRNRRNLGTVAEGRVLPTAREFIAMLSTFGITLLAWTFFRAETVGQAMDMIRGMVSTSLIKWPEFFNFRLITAIAILIVVEWLQRQQQHGLSVDRLPTWARRSSYAAVFLLIFFMGKFTGEDFIYFQF